MNHTKVESWIYFFLGLACFLIPGGVAVFIAYDRRISFAPVFMFTGIVIWGGLFWLFPFICGKLRKGKKKVSFDERDQLIHKKAVMAAYVVLWLYFVAACVIAWCIVGPHGYISVNVMPLTLLGGPCHFYISTRSGQSDSIRPGIKRRKTMNRWQKIAWFNLIVVILCFIACFILTIVLQFKWIMTPPTPLSLIIIPSLFVIAISKLIIRKKSERVDFDERDVQIHKKSHYVGLWAFVLAIVAENVICVLLLGPRRALDYPLILLLMICIAGGIWIMMESIATLVMYGWGGSNGKG